MLGKAQDQWLKRYSVHVNYFFTICSRSQKIKKNFTLCFGWNAIVWLFKWRLQYIQCVQRLKHLCGAVYYAEWCGSTCNLWLLWMKCLSVTIRMNATEQYFLMVLPVCRKQKAVVQPGFASRLCLSYLKGILVIQITIKTGIKAALFCPEFLLKSRVWLICRNICNSYRTFGDISWADFLSIEI